MHLSARLDLENQERHYREFSLLLDDQVIGEGIVRSKPACAPSLPNRAAAHIGYRIEPDFRGKGYGKRWFRLLLDEASKIGLSSVVAACEEGNTVSRRIIEASGGQIFDRVESEFPLIMYRIFLQTN